MTADNGSMVSAGQLLRQAREQRQLTLQQVALQLNLKPELLAKLEQDQFDGTLETFARGYVRAYGRLLKLPEAELMAAFGQHTGCKESSTKPMRTFSNRTARQATENRFMWLTYAMIVLLLVLLFIWWWQTARFNPDQSEANVQADITPVLTAEPQVNPIETESQPEPATAEQLNEMLEQLVPVEDKSAEATETEPAVVADQLEMRFSDNCWVDVVDAEGNRIAFGTKQAGYIMQLSGKAPFVVTLGNPSVVNINFNQQAFDMSALPAGRVAKFTIPESE
jgi:cytoskeleton protein RodZ